MSNYYYSCSVPLNPEMAKTDFIIEDEDIGSFEPPKIYYDGYGEVTDEPMFDYSTDSILMKRGNHVVRFEDVSYFDILLKKENGEPAWFDGIEANILGVHADQVIDVRAAKEYSIEEYDIEKSQGRRYKVVFEETFEMSEGDHRMLETFF